jgi:hydroxysqualene dehydroxylase
VDRDAHELARPLMVPPAPRIRDVAATRTARIAVVGGGWAGLAAAVEAVRRGHAVTLFDMAPQLGGRARSVKAADRVLDNGQHILIGAYVDALALLRTVGVDADRALLRTPLRITQPDGTGLHLAAGSPITAFMRAVLRQRGWRLAERLALLRAAAGWALRRFRCDPLLTVGALTAHLPARVRDELIDPLCVAALNTPAHEASASVFLRVLKDALFTGPGSADLLLPRVGLSDLLAAPAQRWLAGAGAELQLQQRVTSLAPDNGAWSVNGNAFDRVVLATSATEAARLTQTAAPAWSHAAAALHYEPIVTVYLHSAGTRLPEPMLALRSSADVPAQFVFDRGQLGGPEGLLAFVISGAQPWVERGAEATLQATMSQALAVLNAHLKAPLRHVQTLTEKRATFRCTPALQRPAMHIAPGLSAAGDYISGPYPATLEGAVRSGLQAAASLG